MKCKDCGKEVREIKYVFKTEDEKFLEDGEEAKNAYIVGTKPDIVNGIEFKNQEEVYNYFKRLFDSYTEGGVAIDSLILKILKESNEPFKNLNGSFIALNEKKEFKLYVH